MRCLACGVPLSYYSSPAHADRPSCDGSRHRFVWNAYYYAYWCVAKCEDYIRSRKSPCL